jgi:hypothetical protein
MTRIARIRTNFEQGPRLSGIFFPRRPAGKFWIRGHVGWQQVKLLHLRSPGDDLRAFENTGVIESADLNEDRTGRTLRARGQMDSANLTEVSCRTPRMIVVGERAGISGGKLKRLGVDRHEEISCPARNHLTGAAITQTSETPRPAAFVANGLAVTAAGSYHVGCIHWIILANDAHHWRAANDFRNANCTRSPRPVGPAGSALEMLDCSSSPVENNLPIA